MVEHSVYIASSARGRGIGAELLQLDTLVAAGVQKRDVFSDVTSGSKTAIERTGMKKLLEYAEDGDTVVVWRVDRLGRSLIDVLRPFPRLGGGVIGLRQCSHVLATITACAQSSRRNPPGCPPSDVRAAGQNPGFTSVRAARKDVDEAVLETA